MALAVRVFVDHLPERAWEADRRDDSFAEMYARCRAELVALCRRQLGPMGDAEAIAQDAFLKAWVSLDRYSSARPFWPWLATIARRLCVDHLRRRQLEQQHLHTEQEFHGGGLIEPERAAETKEECQAALKALRTLRPREQRIIGLREIDGWSIEQLARFEGISVDATRTALRRARVALRQSYERVLAGAPAMFLIGLLARAKARLVRLSSKVNPSTTAMIATRGGELLVIALVVAAGQGAPVNTTEAAPAPGAIRPAAAAAEPGAAEQDRGVVSIGAPKAKAATSGTASTPTAAADGNGAAAPEGPLGGAPFDRVATPDDARITSFTMSPQYEHDGTIFASGMATTECTTQQCPVLFVSHDRGASWQRLPAGNFLGGRILVPPAYPLDNRLFAAGPTALLLSKDGGQSFGPLTATGGEAAMSPGFSTDDPRIVVSGKPGWVYDDKTGVARPGLVAAPSSSLSGVPEFAPDADGTVMLVGGTTATATSPSTSAVFACNRTACATRAVLGGISGEPRVRLSPSFTSTGEAWAWRGNALFRSADGGSTFDRAALPAKGTIRDVLFGAGSTRFAALGQTPGGPGGVFRSQDGGASWSIVRDTPVEALAVLPDGRLLAANEGDGGMTCSVDGGVTWQQSRCA